MGSVLTIAILKWGEKCNGSSRIEQGIQSEAWQTEVSFQLCDPFTGLLVFGGGDWVFRSDSGEEEVLGGVFGADELDEFGAISGGLEVEGSEPVGEPLGKSFR